MRDSNDTVTINDTTQDFYDNGRHLLIGMRDETAKTAYFYTDDGTQMVERGTQYDATLTFPSDSAEINL